MQKIIKEIVVVEQRKLLCHPAQSNCLFGEGYFLFSQHFWIWGTQKKPQQNRKQTNKTKLGFVKTTFMMRPGTENSGITQNMHNKRSGHHTSKATPTFCILLSTAAICIISYSFDNQPFNPTVKCCSKNTCNPKHIYVTLLFSEVGKWLSLQLMDASVSHTFSNIITWCLNFKQTVEHSLSDTTTHVFKCQVKRSRYWIKVSLYLIPFWTMYWIKCPLFVTGMVASLCSLSVQTHIIVRVYSRARLWGISATWKKIPRKIYVAASNGVQKK